MSDKKQIMVRLDPEDYEILRRHAYEARSPVAVLARVLIMQRLENLEFERRLPEHDGQESPQEATAETPPASSPGRRSPNAKRSKKKKVRR